MISSDLLSLSIEVLEDMKAKTVFPVQIISFF